VPPLTGAREGPPVRRRHLLWGGESRQAEGAAVMAQAGGRKRAARVRAGDQLCRLLGMGAGLWLAGPGPGSAEGADLAEAAALAGKTPCPVCGKARLRLLHFHRQGERVGLSFTLCAACRALVPF